jgi:hypothetical protein
VLNALSDFLRRWSDDISRYGFLGALLGAVPEQPHVVHGRKAVAMRGTPVQRRLAQAMPRPAASLNLEPANLDSEWGPGSGLRHRREPTL